MKQYRKKSNRMAELAYKIKRADELFNIDEFADIDGVIQEYRAISQDLILELVNLAQVQKRRISRLDNLNKIRSIRFKIEKMTEQINGMISLKKCAN